MAEALGVDMRGVYVRVFTLGSMLGTLGGALVIPSTAAMSEMGVELIVEAFAVVVIGGLGSMRGALAGALVVGVLRAIAIAVYPELEMLLIYLIVIAVLVLRPRGLFGKVGRRMRRPGAVALVLAVAARGSPSPASAPVYHVTLMLPFMAYGVALLGLNLLFGYTGLVSFGHALFLGIGAYTGAFLTTHTPVRSLELILVVAALVAAVVAAPVGALCVRYVKIYFGMLTLAFGMLFYTFVLKFYHLTGGDEGMRFLRPIAARPAPAPSCRRRRTWSARTTTTRWRSLSWPPPSCGGSSIRPSGSASARSATIP